MAKSPAKFGLGEYSDEPFELKSGNQPAFKRMGSPLAVPPPPPDDTGTPGWKTALGLVGEMALSGLDAVYGTGKVVSGSERLKKKGDKEKCYDADGNVVLCGGVHDVNKDKNA